MREKPTTEQIAKLPRWVQEHIADLVSERETAVRALNEHLDSETPSPFRVQDLVCTGEEQGPSSKTRYIQAHRMEVVYKGIELTIYLRDNAIELGWSSEDRAVGEVAMIPYSFQQVRLKAKEQM